MAKLFMHNTPQSMYERQMQTVPRYELTHQDRVRQKLIQKYIRLLIELITDLELANARSRIENAIYTYFGDDDEMFFQNNKHRTNFYAFKQKAEKNQWPIMQKNHCVAAVYLLASHDFFASVFPRIISRNRVILSNISLTKANEEIYDLFQAARFLCDGADKLTYEDITEPGILDDRVIALIINAFIINKYGFKALPPYYFSKDSSRNRSDTHCLV